MTQPATGTTWSGAGLSSLDSRFLERGKLVQALIRDARGAATDISPHNDDGSVRWSPFAQDGKWRDDLFARKLENGFWVTNPNSNEGFHLIGAFKEGDGPSSSPNINNDDFMILQSNWPFDSDLVEEGEPFTFMGVQTGSPVLRRLRNNLRLNDASGNVLVEDPGYSNAGWSRPVDGENFERQVLLVREYRKGGLPIYTVDGYALAKLSNLGQSKKDKTDSEAAEMEYTPLPDGHFMAMVDGEYRPIIKHSWVGGAGWTALGGVPVFPGAAPVATQTGATTATVVFDAATGAGDPFTYTLEKETGSVWSSATIDSVDLDTPSAGDVTLNVTGLVTATAYTFRVTAEGTNAATAVSQVSNQVTTA